MQVLEKPGPFGVRLFYFSAISAGCMGSKP